MTNWDLNAMPGCFDGVIPPVIATASALGEPNVTHLSQVHLVDERHVAVTNQFFGKTSANLAHNPRASALITDSQTYATYRFALRFERTESDGPLFDGMRAALESIGRLMQMEDVFKLRGVDVYEVLEVHRISTAGAR